MDNENEREPAPNAPKRFSLSKLLELGGVEVREIGNILYDETKRPRVGETIKSLIAKYGK
jgi:hypothetical protein